MNVVEIDASKGKSMVAALYATGDIAQILSLDKQTVLNHKNRAVQKYKSIIPKVSKG